MLLAVVPLQSWRDTLLPHKTLESCSCGDGWVLMAKGTCLCMRYVIQPKWQGAGTRISLLNRSMCFIAAMARQAV